MAIPPRFEEGETDSELMRSRCIVGFICDDYHKETVGILEAFQKFAETLGDAYPNNAIMYVFQTEIRNAMDHLGRATNALSMAALREHVAMAGWHLDLGKMSALAHMADMSNALADQIIAGTPGLRADLISYRSYLFSELRSLKLKTFELVVDLSSIKEKDRTTPLPEEMDRTHYHVDNQRGLLYAYARLLVLLQRSRT